MGTVQKLSRPSPIRHDERKAQQVIHQVHVTGLHPPRDISGNCLFFFFGNLRKLPKLKRRRRDEEAFLESPPKMAAAKGVSLNHVSRESSDIKRLAQFYIEVWSPFLNLLKNFIFNTEFSSLFLGYEIVDFYIFFPFIRYLGLSKLKVRNLILMLYGWNWVHRFTFI